MQELLLQFSTPVQDATGRLYVAEAWGAEMAHGMWHGWIEFLPADGANPISTGRETTQPNRTDVEYWATGLSAVYLEGALGRALDPLRPATPIVPPAPGSELPPEAGSILNPFSVYRKGEAMLRSQLSALSARHLVNIVRAHGLSDLDQSDLNQLPPAAVVELIIDRVRLHVTTPG